MIHLITASNRHLYPRELATLHRERRRHFIEERGWPLEERDGGEYDAYDDELADHLVGFAPDGSVEVSCRLRPTGTDGVLPDVFPHLLAPAEAPARAPGTWECTRYLCARAARGRTGFESRSKLHLATVEHIRGAGGDRLLGFVDLEFLTYLRRFSGLRIRPVGLPAEYAGGGQTIAFEIGVTQADLEAARERLQLPTRQLFAAPGWLPAGTDVFALERFTQVLLAGPEAARRALRAKATTLAARVARPDVEAVLAGLAATA